jgi:hypothetical protein
VFRFVFALLLSLFVSVSRAATLDFSRDTLAFSNDTFWAYAIAPDGTLKIQSRPKTAEPNYTRHCLVMCRATLQFKKWVRFDPAAKKLTDAQYRDLIKRIARKPAWVQAQPAARRIVVPGFANLREFSKAKARIVQDEIGIWWTTYWRIGNWRMALPFPRFEQRQFAELTERLLTRGEIVPLFMTRFHPLNHCVLVFAAKPLPNGDVEFAAYDPNNAQQPLRLRFEAATSSFYLPRTKYYPGGRVNVFRTYYSPVW